ncbi:SseB protein N-terminal domain-containing protein [Micromonospora coriariae]|uniref:SseB protein N-terminal domain-containing protein n=1 Tax=Micromonospora coriariae TaxID=285665 RepID=A0A1C4VIM5_9ACTN|nr:SseB family protein [Micromonospora coriariae]SCE83780.1 SseB protein N-terminal domain-containing protein [Micromonospora coriariae]
MTEWEPATEAEVAMRDALRANDQELYFRLLSRTDLLLPVSAPAAPGQAPPGWGTWTTGGRTHVLAFTSTAALRTCLGEHSGSNRRVPFTELAVGWPNHEWWLAVNPGLPVEGYLPAWFVAQLSRGDVRLPGRAMGARARLERAETLARSRTGMTGRDVPTTPGSTSPGSDPVATPPERLAPTRGAVPRMGAPTVPGTSSRTPGPGELSRRGEDMPAAGQRYPTGPPRPGGPGAESVPTSRPAASRFTPLKPADHPGVVPADQPAPGAAWPAPSRPGSDVDGPAVGNGSAQGGPRSFFEPASDRDRAAVPTSGGGRAGDRAAPPSRFARGSQPFPRRRPADAPAGDGATTAFPMPDPDATRPLRSPAGDLGAPRGVRAPAPDDEPTQPLPPRRPAPLADEPTRAFRSPGRATGEPPLARAGRPAPSADETQAIPRGQPGDPGRFEPVEELPPSIAEPVSGPPAPRRGFTPIVIEGTIIESRDLTEPAEASSVADATVRPGPESSAPPSVGPPNPGPGPAAPASSGPPSSAPHPFGSRPYGPPPADPATSGPSSDPGPFSPSFGPASSDPGPFGPGSGGPAGAVPGSVRADEMAEGHSDAADPADLGGQSPGSRTASGAAPARPDADGERAVPDGDGRDALAEAPAPVEFLPANTVEEDLLGAAGAGSTDTFLSTLLLARVLLPAAPDSVRGSRPGDPGFVWRTAQLDGETYVVVYTSPERLADHAEGEVDVVRVKFAQLIRRWPDEDWSFAVNPGTPVGAKLPGEQIVALANWAAEVGLGDDLEVDPEEQPVVAEPAARPRYAPAAVDPARPTVMQKAIAPSQLAYYLDRGYDRVSGFVHRAGELAHLTTPAQLYDALGLSYPGSPFARDAEEIYVLRWPAHRPSLYRIPYGGQNEPAMRAMEGWVIERPPFRGNGFAPGESSDVVAEFKVDSARLPYGAQLWRIGADGTERVVAVLDTDAVLWRRVGEA